MSALGFGSSSDDSGIQTFERAPVIYLARGRWWLVLAIVAADVVISLTFADTVIRWELEQLGRAWRGE